ncbi:hypothetical protein ACS0TY_023699 [Phlomoides rotata]
MAWFDYIPKHTYKIFRDNPLVGIGDQHSFEIEDSVQWYLAEYVALVSQSDSYADWQVGTGEGDGVKALIAFYPPEASSSNVSIVITGLGADYTKLESFGKVDAFAETLIGGLDRSWKSPPGVAAKLIDSRASNGMYYIEYTLKNPGESRRHLYSVLGMADNGTYNKLYTLTGQFVDEDEEKLGPMIQKAVSSFRLN